MRSGFEATVGGFWKGNDMAKSEPVAGGAETKCICVNYARDPKCKAHYEPVGASLSAMSEREHFENIFPESVGNWSGKRYQLDKWQRKYETFRIGWQAALYHGPENFVLELAKIYGLDETFLRALPNPTMENWQMLVREEAKRHKLERDTMEKFRTELTQLKFGGASLSAQTPPGEADRKCPKCGTTMCGKFDYRPGPTPLTELAIPNGQFSCLKCGYDPLSNEELTTIFRKQPCDHGNATSMPIGECTMTTECAKETIAQLTLEIRNLAHRGWEDWPNAEFLFREIGQRAQKISSLSGAAQEEAPREEWRAGMKEAAQIADHFANDELSVVEWPEYGLMARDRRCDSGMTGVMGERIAAAIRAKLTPGVVAEEEATITLHDWIHEDELPKDYPYHAMFPYSIIPGGIGCRVFPRLPERVKVEEEAGAPPVVEYRSFCKICHRAIRLWSGTRETGDWVHAEQNVSSDHWAVPFEDQESKK